jgi:SAM-dependent methyltransferase
LNPIQDPRRAAVWSRYWQAGSAHACPGTVDERLGGALGAFWRDAAGFLAAGQRVLEIGAGNGAVTRLILDACAAAAPDIDAVDLARLRPAWPSELAPTLAAHVQFHEGTSAEQLPFEDSRFDLVVGQFALEYMSRAAVLPELRRCGRPGGRLAFVLHHRDSELVRVAAHERRHLARLLEADGLLDATDGLVADVARARTPEGVHALQRDAAAEARRRRYNELQMQLEAEARTAAAPDVLDEAAAAAAAVLQLAAREGEAAARRQLQARRQACQDAMVRLDELLACALDEAALRRLVADFASLGYGRATTGTLADAGRLIGWTLTASREA